MKIFDFDAYSTPHTKQAAETIFMLMTVEMHTVKNRMAVLSQQNANQFWFDLEAILAAKGLVKSNHQQSPHSFRMDENENILHRFDHQETDGTVICHRDDYPEIKALCLKYDGQLEVLKSEVSKLGDEHNKKHTDAWKVINDELIKQGLIKSGDELLGLRSGRFIHPYDEKQHGSALERILDKLK